MQKLRLFFLLLLFPSLIFAQQRSKVILDKSEVANVDARTKIMHVKKPVFIHDNAILTCDSARFWNELNYFEAFGHVHINQGDTINIFSDLLNYDGNQKLAHLIDNVRLSDPTTTLTTNVFDYNMGTKIGQYVQKGKIVNKEAEITSKNGYYFSNTKDAYFKYDVIVKTKQATITSDTLRYNTGNNWTYFYGPTNIKGKDDNLYTEDGAYNTKSENAYFGKKNLYTQGSKTLKGDSLYYYGKTGYGKAVRNIVFTDSEDKLLLRGQLGEYYKKDERVIVTKNAYVGIGTADSISVNDKFVPDTLWLGADRLEAQMVLQKSLKLLAQPVILKDDEVGAEDEKKKEAASAQKPVATPRKPIIKQPSPKENPKKSKKTSKKERAKAESNKDLENKADSLVRPPDSVKLAVDTTRTSLKKILKSDSLLKSDTLKTMPKIAATANKLKAVANKAVVDSIPFNPADTVRTRTISAFHNVRVFKSNLQAKSDSLFFTAADSTLRLYQNPMLWSDRSQQTGDTIHIQFKNKKINSAQVLQNGFIVNLETDTTKFNQVKGKIITAFFNDGEIRNLYVDGNAESIYYTKDNKDAYDNINQTVSSRIRIIFEDKELSRVKTVKQVEGTFTPIDKAPKESILTGFIWKPELRPKSKADIIKGLPLKTTEPSLPKSKAVPKPVKKNSTGTKAEAIDKTAKPRTSKPVVNP
ncbi:MAG: OstA-like protein [Bacteroidota bacterium]